MHGTEQDMSWETKGAFGDALGRGVDGLEDVENGDLAWLAGEEKAAMETALGGDEVGLHHGLKDLGKIAMGDKGTFRDLRGGVRIAMMLREVDSGAQCIFSGGGNQILLSKNWI